MIGRLLIGIIKAYRLVLSPWLGSSCRFHPTCSAYALQALQMHGTATGSYLMLKRLGRCHPWCEGGLDPVPNPKTPVGHDLFARLISTSSEKKSS
jgi:putative membrane protein insertion efficiency factor